MRKKILKAVQGNKCIKQLFLAMFLCVTISVFLSHRSIMQVELSPKAKPTVRANANSEKIRRATFRQQLLDKENVLHQKDLLINRQNIVIAFLEKLLELNKHGRNIPPCKPTTVEYCHDLTCPVTFSASPTERLQQVLATRDDSLEPYLDAMDRSADPVRPHRLIFVSAASSNHYGELQALVHNVRCHLFPRLDNFTFVIYDLGLTPKQRNLTEKNCNCTVLDFPFSFLPDFFSMLTCYTWKPLIINALLKKSEMTMWMDTSVVWKIGAPLDDLFQLVKKRGVLLGISDLDGAIALRTRPSMFQFFGDKACQYHQFAEMWGTYILFHNEPFIRHALVEPWLACAFNRECMCIPDHWKWMGCIHTNPREEGVCHRFDQSSLGIILSRLFLDRSRSLNFPNDTVDIRRSETMEWFGTGLLQCYTRTSQGG